MGTANPAPAIRWIIAPNGEIAPHNNLLMFGLAAGEREPQLVAKVCRSPRFNWTICNEYHHLLLLWQQHGEAVRGMTPRPLALVQAGRDMVFLMTFCPGRSLPSPGCAFWRDEPQMENLLTEAGRWLHRLHTLPVDSAGENTGFRFAQRAATFRSFFGLEANEVDVLDHVAAEVAKLQRQANGRVLIQGDLWPGNMILGEPANDLTLVDWQFSRWSARVDQDVYLLLLTAALAAVKSGRPQQRARAAVDRLHSWQKRLIPRYLESYGPPDGVHLLPLWEGMLACCVEMATRPFLAFGTRQEDEELWRHLYRRLAAQKDEG